jgi:hypothetical protein
LGLPFCFDKSNAWILAPYSAPHTRGQFQAHTQPHTLVDIFQIILLGPTHLWTVLSPRPPHICGKFCVAFDKPFTLSQHNFSSRPTHLWTVFSPTLAPHLLHSFESLSLHACWQAVHCWMQTMGMLQLCWPETISNFSVPQLVDISKPNTCPHTCGQFESWFHLAPVHYSNLVVLQN